MGPVVGRWRLSAKKSVRSSGQDGGPFRRTVAPDGLKSAQAPITDMALQRGEYPPHRDRCYARNLLNRKLANESNLRPLAACAECWASCDHFRTQCTLDEPRARRHAATSACIRWPPRRVPAQLPPRRSLRRRGRKHQTQAVFWLRPITRNRSHSRGRFLWPVFARPGHGS